MSELKRHHINEVMDMHCLTRGEMGYSWVYYADDVDGVIAKLKARIHELENMPHTDNSEVIDALETENEALKKELAELREATRWRKCSDELPQNGQDVWAYDSKSNSVLRLEYEKSDEGEGFIVFPYKHDFLQNITQWMPFEKPKAPEEK